LKSAKKPKAEESKKMQYQKKVDRPKTGANSNMPPPPAQRVQGKTPLINLPMDQLNAIE